MLRSLAARTLQTRWPRQWSWWGGVNWTQTGIKRNPSVSAQTERVLPVGPSLSLSLSLGVTLNFANAASLTRWKQSPVHWSHTRARLRFALRCRCLWPWARLPRVNSLPPVSRGCFPRSGGGGGTQRAVPRLGQGEWRSCGCGRCQTTHSTAASPPLWEGKQWLFTLFLNCYWVQTCVAAHTFINQVVSIENYDLKCPGLQDYIDHYIWVVSVCSLMWSIAYLLDQM